MSSYKYPPAPPQNGSTFIEPVHHDTYPAIDPSTKSDLTGRSVLITGASKGVGRATALSYARAGASHIAIAARSDLSSLEQEILVAAAHSASANSHRAAPPPSPQVLRLELDVQSHESVQRAARAVADAFGRLDVLINNAGCLESARFLADSDPDIYWATWEVNYRGAYWMTRAFLPLLLLPPSPSPSPAGTRLGPGLRTIVNVSSLGAHGLRPGVSAYQGSKYALLRLTEFTCTEYAAQGVLAYSVHPGGVPTELALNLPKEVHPLLVDKPELAADAMVFLTQVQRQWLAGRYISLNWDIPTLLSSEAEIVAGDKLKMRMVV